jgi:hypothetical protein
MNNQTPLGMHNTTCNPALRNENKLEKSIARSLILLKLAESSVRDAIKGTKWQAGHDVKAPENPALLSKQQIMMFCLLQ